MPSQHAPVPHPGDAIDKPFWDGLEVGELRIQRCSGCGRWTWPPQWRCGPCGSWEMAWAPVAMVGVVHSLTWVRHPFTPAMAELTPFANLLIELPHAGGARLLGLCSGSAEGLEIGSEVEGAVTRDTDGRAALRWRIAR